MLQLWIFFVPPFQIKMFGFGSHSSLCLFTFVHAALNKAPAAMVAMKHHLSFPVYRSPIASLPQGTACPVTSVQLQPQLGQTSSRLSLTHLRGRFKLCQAVLGSARNVENEERNPEGADAAELLGQPQQGCSLYPWGYSTAPQAALVHANRPWNRGQRALARFCFAQTLSSSGSLPWRKQNGHIQHMSCGDPPPHTRHICYWSSSPKSKIPLFLVCASQNTGGNESQQLHARCILIPALQVVKEEERILRKVYKAI